MFVFVTSEKTGRSLISHMTLFQPDVTTIKLLFSTDIETDPLYMRAVTGGTTP